MPQFFRRFASRETRARASVLSPEMVHRLGQGRSEQLLSIDTTTRARCGSNGDD